MKKEIKKVIKKTNKRILFCLFLFLFIGIIGGYATVMVFTRNDTFELNGEKSIVLKVNQEYKEEGVNIISFGKNIKDKVEIESNVDTSKEGEYTVVYTVKSIFKYKDVKRVRYVSVQNGSDTNE